MRPSSETIARWKATAPTHGGIDFGFHNPFAAVSGFLTGDDELVINGLRYKNNCTMPVHSEALPRGVQWWADPSGAESIAALRQAGHSVMPCVHMPRRGATGEKQSAKLAGIDQVNERMRTGRLWIVRTPETMPLIRELGMYHYDETKQVEEPVDEDNHACDALRYLVVGIDRGRSVPLLMQPETIDEQRAREDMERQADLDRRAELDRMAQEDPFDDRWFRQ